MTLVLEENLGKNGMKSLKKARTF